ncbi:MAG: hypothetical protein IJU20_01950 [Clostridia bacterium]|nr:hypothetical protein [Clostridia bacterium]
MDFKKIALHGCMWYTVLSLLVLFVNLAIKGNFSDVYVEPLWFLRIFAFSVLFALANGLYANKGVRPLLRAFLHAVIVIPALLVFFVLPYAKKAGMTFTGGFLFFLIVTILYSIAAVVLYFTILKKKLIQTGPSEAERSEQGRRGRRK